MTKIRAFARFAALAASAAFLTGCMSFQPIEPVKNPPLSYRFDTTVPVEFVHPTKVGFRCAERGAKFLMMPGINSQACASPDLVTMPNPCMTVTGGWYAAVLCHELAHANGWSPSHKGGNWVPDKIKFGTARPDAAQIEKIKAEEMEAKAALMTPVEMEEAAEVLKQPLESVDLDLQSPAPVMSEAMEIVPETESEPGLDVLDIASDAPETEIAETNVEELLRPVTSDSDLEEAMEPEVAKADSVEAWKSAELLPNRYMSFVAFNYAI
ncbi:hypothetical protein [Hirschia baltica]|uniref:Lipoprotein n=1 Tax=Hirschia baltica (strain ATCC 49814 / DSM 5838 / IFAM 1418) TaxID=582402 RepID=C6XK33_HIRBI|nr:hypothetical protein [Hirschia baltica]ACT59478.1 hypothetical protein Hbal_1792 [Hirschia baltica ATCC 49814]